MTEIIKPEIDQTVYVETVILIGSGTYKSGETFSEVLYRAPKRLWKKDMGGTVEGFIKWMRKHDPNYTDDFSVRIVREENTDANLANQKPEL